MQVQLFMGDAPLSTGGRVATLFPNRKLKLWGKSYTLIIGPFGTFYAAKGGKMFYSRDGRRGWRSTHKNPGRTADRYVVIGEGK